jgi:hypothetical protein
VWTKIVGLAARINPPITASSICFQLTGSQSHEITDCFGTAGVVGGSYYTMGLYGNPTNAYIKARNNVFTSFAATVGSTGMYFLGTGSGSLGYYFANTIYGCGYGILKGNIEGSITVKNNLVFTCTNCFHTPNTFATGSTNNAYSEGTDPGVNGTSVAGYSDTAICVAPASSNFRLATTSPVKGKGASLSSDPDFPVTLDLDRTTRKAVPDIGAYEIPGELEPEPAEAAPSPMRPRPGRLPRKPRQRSVDFSKEADRQRRDIVRHFMGMYRRLESGGPD